MITTGPRADRSCGLLPPCRTGGSYSPLMAELLRLFSGETLQGMVDGHKIGWDGKEHPAGSRGPDCPVTAAWLWAELLGTAGVGSTCRQERGHVWVGT